MNDYGPCLRCGVVTGLYSGHDREDHGATSVGPRVYCANCSRIVTGLDPVTEYRYGKAANDGPSRDSVSGSGGTADARSSD